MPRDSYDAYFMPSWMQDRCTAADARYAKVAAAQAALDAALAEMKAADDASPYAGYDIDDIPTSADLETPDAFALAMERHVQEDE